MQTISSLDIKIFKGFWWVIFLLSYEIATTQFGFLPPLIGIFFTYMILEYSRKQKQYDEFKPSWYFSLVFLVFAEQIHGFYLFSTIIAFLLFYNFVLDWLYTTMKWRNCLLIIFVASGYVLTFLVNNLFAYVLNEPNLTFSAEYLFFIALESVFAIVLFRDKVL
ncbi:hypothetical protein [Campylobacter concisus]|uniref:hypothetical protein n=1 Tax=Campylobacter concisus TaxID=199 RepID=UPI000D31E125|nr:hypothetical protein [Campylobacter concisus]